MPGPLRSAAVLLLIAAPAFAEAPADAPRPVRVQEVAFAAPESAVAYSGTVRARVQADLAFRVGGKVIERPVSVGDRVSAGQVLARLDPADLRLAAESAEEAVRAAAADAVNAEAELRRYESLGRASPAFVASEYDRRLAATRAAEARLAQAQRGLALARDQLGYATLTADAEGVVTALSVEVGQVVAPGQTVAALAHAAETEVAVDVPENRLAEVRAAADIRITLWSAPDAVLHGRLREVGALADPASRTFTVKVAVPEAPPGLLGLGMTALVRFVRPSGPPVVLLPGTALAGSGDAPAVWVLDEARHRAALRQVRLAGFAPDGRVAVTDGLAPGEKVVTAGLHALDPDLPVTAWAGPTR